MTPAVLDDHLLRDLLSGEVSEGLATVLAGHEPATTNLYYVRLCKSVVSARGGRLTGSWAPERRRSLGRTLMELPEAITVVPMRFLGFRVAELAETHRLSTLGAEAVAAAEHLGAPLVVWDGDDGPRIRAATAVVGTVYRTVAR
ncbi:MAG: hypothetical protein QOJ69_5 [Actinomycetota bacterium]|nr:hypothetical protein [Actinomycetota bacterium]